MRTCMFAAALGLSAGFAQGQVELYRQQQALSPGGHSSQEARNAGGIGWFSEAADDFVSQAGWTINNVKFFGGYVTAPTAPGNTQGFVIRFYSNNNGLPGTELFEQEVTQFNETQYGLVGPWAAYSYSCNLSPAFTPPTPGVYWFSTVAILDRGGTSQEPQWGWGATVNPVAGNSCVQWFFSPGNFTPQGSDLAMVLSGTNGAACYANCDGSTGTPQLTGNDFACFLTLYASNSSLANCDGSTGVPALTANDFQCFLTAYAVGCS